MIKFEDTAIVFREVPDEITLAINLTNCPHHCKGCHSPHLWEDRGLILTADGIDTMLEEPSNVPVTCVAFMGGDNDPDTLFEINREFKRRHPNMKTCWYTGYSYEDHKFLRWSHRLTEFDYVKMGRYREELGPIDKEGSNQVMFKTTSKVSMENITERFRKRI